MDHEYISTNTTTNNLQNISPYVCTPAFNELTLGTSGMPTPSSPTFRLFSESMKYHPVSYISTHSERSTNYSLSQLGNILALM